MADKQEGAASGERAVAGQSINAPVFTGDITGDVHIYPPVAVLRDQEKERPEPISIHLDLNAKIVDREAECAAVLDELRKKDGRRVLPIVAPAGFGKTSLAVKVLQQVTDG